MFNRSFLLFCPSQVLVPAAGIRGFLDASEFGTWLKHFQSSNKMDKHNIKHFLLAGQVRFDFCYLHKDVQNKSYFAAKKNRGPMDF